MKIRNKLKFGTNISNGVSYHRKKKSRQSDMGNVRNRTSVRMTAIKSKLKTSIPLDINKQKMS